MPLRLLERGGSPFTQTTTSTGNSATLATQQRLITAKCAKSRALSSKCVVYSASTQTGVLKSVIHENTDASLMSSFLALFGRRTLSGVLKSTGLLNKGTHKLSHSYHNNMSGQIREPLNRKTEKQTNCRRCSRNTRETFQTELQFACLFVHKTLMLHQFSNRQLLYCCFLLPLPERALKEANICSTHD